VVDELLAQVLRRIAFLLALPLERLERLALEVRVQAIGASESGT